MKNRELKRVPLNFNYPLKKVWTGYEDMSNPIEPPTGEGYQLWERISEGSPISPVFKTPEELYTWAAENATVFAHIKISDEDWKRYLNDEDVHIQAGGLIVF